MASLMLVRRDRHRKVGSPRFCTATATAARFSEWQALKCRGDHSNVVHITAPHAFGIRATQEGKDYGLLSSGQSILPNPRFADSPDLRRVFWGSQELPESVQ